MERRVPKVVFLSSKTTILSMLDWLPEWVARSSRWKAGTQIRAFEAGCAPSVRGVDEPFARPASGEANVTHPAPKPDVVRLAYSVGDAAKALSVSEETIRRALAHNLIVGTY